MRKWLVITAVLALAATLASAAPMTTGDLLRLVPQGAKAIVAIDSAALRAHPSVQSWLAEQHAWAATDETLRRFLDDAGLDPLRDVDLILLAVTGEGSATRGVVFLIGRYDAGALNSALTARGASPFTLAGVPALRLPDSGHCGAPPVMLQRSSDLVIVGDETSVAATVAPEHAIPDLVAGEIADGRIDLRAPFWMAATVPAAARRHAGEAAEHARGEGSEALRGALLASGTVQKVTARAYLDDSLRVFGAAVADSAEDAGLLRDAVKGAVAAARLHVQGASPELVDVLRGVEIAVDGAVVTGKGSIPVALLEKLRANHSKGHGPDAI